MAAAAATEAAAAATEVDETADAERRRAISSDSSNTMVSGSVRNADFGKGYAMAERIPAKTTQVALSTARTILLLHYLLAYTVLFRFFIYFIFIKIEF